MSTVTQNMEYLPIMPSMNTLGILLKQEKASDLIGIYSMIKYLQHKEAGNKITNKMISAKLKLSYKRTQYGVNKLVELKLI